MMLKELRLPVKLLSVFHEKYVPLISVFTYENIREIGTAILTKKEAQPPSQGYDACTSEATLARAERDEQREARRANIKPNVGSHLEVGRSRDAGLHHTSRLRRQRGQHIQTHNHVGNNQKQV